MKISVIIPAFNVASWIKGAIDSVLKQDFKDWELIVVDDGSTDETPAIVDRIAAQDSRVLLKRQANAGPGVARNVGIDSAMGDYLLFLDSDDELASPTVLSSLVKRMENAGCDVLLARARSIGLHGESRGEITWCLRKDILPSLDDFTPKDAGVSLFFVAGSVPWGKIYRREFLSREKIRFPSLPRSEDFPFVQTAMACARKIAIYDGIMILHRVGRDDSLESTKDETPLVFAEAETAFFKMLEARGLWGEFAQAAKARAMRRLAYNLTAVRSFDGLRAVFACAGEERKKLNVVGVADSFRDYVIAREMVDGTLSYGSVEAWIYARMVEAEKSLREKEAELRKANSDNRMQMAAKTAQNASLLQSRQEVSLLKQKVVVLEKKSLELERSEAYRVGMVVTWPVRKAWGGMRCIWENGFNYTVKHAIGKCMRLLGVKVGW